MKPIQSRLVSCPQSPFASVIYLPMRLIQRFNLRVLIALAVCLIAVLHTGQSQAQLNPFDHLRDRIVAHLVETSRQHAANFAHDQAIAAANLALILDPVNPQLYIERGQRSLLLYEWDRALADFNTAVALAPDLADAYYYRGLLYASAPEGDAARALALADFRYYLDLAPDGAHATTARRYVTQLEASG